MQTVNWAGSSYNIPNQRGDTPWSGLSDFAIAVAAKGLNTGGGNFTLLADVNFGATFGLVSTYYKSRTANIATAGILRLASADTIQWRNNANGANVSLSKNSSDELLWNGSRIVLAGGGLIVNADIAANAAISYSKLAVLTINRAMMSDSSGYPAIATTTDTELQAIHGLTASRALVTNGSGLVTPATTTATEIGYVNGVTSAIQTQINTKAPSASPTFTGTVTLPVTADRALQTGTSSVLEASAVTKTELGYVSGVTSAIQTQLGTKVTSVSGTANQITSSGGTTPTLSLPSPLTTPGSVTITGSLTFSPTTAGIVGTTTNDAAAAGRVGEVIASGVARASSVSLTTGTAKTITSISLTAGQWEVVAMGCLKPTNAGTSITSKSVAISLTDNTLPSSETIAVPDASGQVTWEDAPIAAIVPGNGSTAMIGTIRSVVKVSGTTTVYLVQQASFSVSTCTGFGSITGTRMR